MALDAERARLPANDRRCASQHERRAAQRSGATRWCLEQIPRSLDRETHEAPLVAGTHLDGPGLGRVVERRENERHEHVVQGIRVDRDVAKAARSGDPKPPRGA